VRSVNPLAGLSYESSTLAYFAAVQGHGVAIAQEVLVRDDLEAGRLVTPFTFVLDEGEYTYHLVYPPEHLQKAEFAIFRNWIITESQA